MAVAKLHSGDEPTDESAKLRLRKQVTDTEMDITPMIDITFLLLIFFLVASKMDQSTAVKLPPARHATAVATRNAVVVTIDAATDGATATVYKGDGVSEVSKINTVDLAAMEAELEEYVADTLLEDSRKTQVLIKAAGALRHRDVARVVQAVSRVADVQGLHVAVLEGP